MSSQTHQARQDCYRNLLSWIKNSSQQFGQNTLIFQLAQTEGSGFKTSAEYKTMEELQRICQQINYIYLADWRKYNSLHVGKLLQGFVLTEWSGPDLFCLAVVGPVPHFLELMVIPIDCP